MAKQNDELSLWYTYLSKKERMLSKHYFKYRELQNKAWDLRNIKVYGLKYFKLINREESYNTRLNNIYKKITEIGIIKRVLTDIYSDNPIYGVTYKPQETNIRKVVDFGDK